MRLREVRVRDRKGEKSQKKIGICVCGLFWGLSDRETLELKVKPKYLGLVFIRSTAFSLLYLRCVFVGGNKGF